MPYSSRVGPIIVVPMPDTGARISSARISWSSTTYSSLPRPAPPYSSGQVGTVKPRSAQRSIHSRWSSVIATLVPPPGTTPGPRQLSGQLASSQSRTSLRNDMGAPTKPLSLSNANAAMRDIESWGRGVLSPAETKPPASRSSMLFRLQRHGPPCRPEVGDKRALKLGLPLVGATGLGCAIAVLISWSPDNMEPDNVPGAGFPHDDISPGTVAPPTEATALGVPEATVSNAIPSVQTLRRLCADPWSEGVPDDCKDALTVRYHGEGMPTVRLHYNGGGWEPTSEVLPVEITWEQAFAEPEETRRAVVGALDDPQCRKFIVRDTAEVLGVGRCLGRPIARRPAGDVRSGRGGQARHAE